MSDFIQIGTGKISVPKSSAFIKRPDTAAWVRRSRERREQLLSGSHEVRGQEITPQHQRQQLIAKVQTAQRPQLVAMLNGLASQRDSLSDLFEQIDPASGKQNLQVMLEVQKNELALRSLLLSMIRNADVVQLRKIERGIQQRAARPVSPSASLNNDAPTLSR